MSDKQTPYEKPSVEEVDTDGAPVETTPGPSQPPVSTQG